MENQSLVLVNIHLDNRKQNKTLKALANTQKFVNTKDLRYEIQFMVIHKKTIRKRI